jgi:hypothetical protein
MSTALCALGLIVSACSSSISPSSTTLSAIVPASGTTLGGTMATITGETFSTGDLVTIGGTPATSVSVINATTLVVTTPGHAAGPVDVVVTTPAGQRASLPSAFTYLAPATINTPPVINSIVAQGRVGPREPPGFASLDETIAVAAAVTDAETPAAQLVFEWSADTGSFSGSGPNVSWTAPHSYPAPSTVMLMLTVRERYQTTDAGGAPVARENVVTGATPHRLHDSMREIDDLAVDFLVGFSQQLDPRYVVRNFTSTCPGAAAELSDVQKDNDQFVITSYVIGTPRTSLVFTGPGGCPLRGVFGDACAQVPVTWHSTNRGSGAAGVADGIDQVAAVLENDQWRLCASDFNSTTTSAAVAAFRSHRR